MLLLLLQAEQLLLQLLRSRAGTGGVTEAAANALLSDIETCGSNSSLTGRRLQQLGDYLFRVLLRVHADAAAAAAAAGEEEVADSETEDAAPASPAELEPDLRDDNWETLL